jgi:transcriptional regulator with XRE-family HTH domain
MSAKMLGRTLKALRSARKLNQATLAQRAGVTQPYIVALEKGRENPTLNTLTMLAEVLEVKVRDFFQPGGDEMVQLTAQERKWNEEVKEMASKIKQVEEWARELEKWANKNKDWYTARGSARLTGQLHQAIAETYDLQFFTNDDEISNWKKAQCVE